MSLKRKISKPSTVNHTVVEAALEDEAMFASINTIQSTLCPDGRFLSATNRPAHSRLVNVNCLRPHGTVHDGELMVSADTDAPPLSLLDDIVALVNGSRRLLHRSADFACIGDASDSLALLHGSAFRCWWLDSMARVCESAATFPFTSFRFLAPMPSSHADGISDRSETSLSLQVDPTAEVIRRILLVFARGSNGSRTGWQELLFHSLRSEVAAGAGLITTHYDSRHITVCCGLYFYRVEVLSWDGVVISASALTERLRAVREHAASTERALREQAILPEAREDLIAFHKLIGRLTRLDRAACAALMDRLACASPVNAAALATMDSGIFAVTLHSANNDPRAPPACWHRCALLLEEGARLGDLTLRAHAALVHRDELLAFAEGVLALEPLRGGAPAWDAPRDGGFEYVELWLPWKHRKPMRPYAAAVPAPRATLIPLAAPPAAAGGGGKLAAESTTAAAGGAHSRAGCVPFARLCLAAVLAAQRELAPRGGGGPAVLIAFPHPHGAVSAALLWSAELVAFTQAHRCASALVEKWALRQLAAEALRSVAAIVHACYYAPFPLYALAALLLERGRAVMGNEEGVFGPVELCISAGALGTDKRMLSCSANLVVPARFAIDCAVAGPLPARHASTAGSPVEAHVAVATLSALQCTDDEATSNRLVSSILDEYETLTALLSM